jgi:hypothetical protein
MSRAGCAAGTRTPSGSASRPLERSKEGRGRTVAMQSCVASRSMCWCVFVRALFSVSLAMTRPAVCVARAHSSLAGPISCRVSSAHRESTSRLIASARRAAARHARHTGQGPHPRFSAGMRLCEASKTARLPPVTQGFGDRIARRAYVSTTCAASAGTSTRGARGTTVLARDRHGHDRDLRAAGQHCLRGVDWSAVGVGPGQILFACL